MRPLSPEERREILALNPGATSQDLELFESLLAERVSVSRSDPTRRQRLEERLTQMEEQLFPRLTEALERVASQRVETPDGLEDEPIV